MRVPKYVPIVIVALVVLAAAVAYGLWSHRKPDSLSERSSYTIGLQFGRTLAQQKLDLDPAMVARGLNDGLKEHAFALSEEEQQEAMVKLNENRQKQTVDEAAENKKSADEFLDRNRIAEGVKVLKSGVQYKSLAEGKGKSPGPDDIVVMNYKAALALDGKEFDSSYKRGVPVELPMRGMLTGWKEGVSQMKPGGHALIYIPPELAYGDRPRQGIPSNSVLVFDTELVGVHGAPKEPAPKK